MRRDRELTDPNSCLNKADNDEMMFVLLARDPAAPVAIRAWIAERVRLGINTFRDDKILEADACAMAMDRERPHRPKPDPYEGWVFMKPTQQMVGPAPAISYWTMTAKHATLPFTATGWGRDAAAAERECRAAIIDRMAQHAAYVAGSPAPPVPTRPLGVWDLPTGPVYDRPQPPCSVTNWLHVREENGTRCMYCGTPKPQQAPRQCSNLTGHVKGDGMVCKYCGIPWKEAVLSRHSYETGPAEPCPNDTDGDGNCHLCYTLGGCPKPQQETK